MMTWAANDPSNISDRLKAIAFTAGFHFAFIEQGGTSLYATLAQKVRSPEVLRILLSIGGSEIMHFQTWQDKAGNATPPTCAIIRPTGPDQINAVNAIRGFISDGLFLGQPDESPTCFSVWQTTPIRPNVRWRPKTVPVQHEGTFTS
jgi:hypothetical protein